MTTALRAAAAVALLAGVYVLALLLVVGDVSFFIVWATHSDESEMTDSVIPTVRFSVLPILAVLVGLLTISGRRGAVVADSIEVRADDAPALHAAVTGLAAAIGTRPPDEIRLVAEPIAEVSEETRFLGLFAGARRMYVGVPLLVALSTDELRAVLCHELGHYAGSHTRLGAIAYRSSEALRETRRRLSLHGGSRRPGSLLARLAERLFAGYSALVLGLSSATRRRQEVEADAAAAAIAGKQALASALRSVHTLQSAWDFFLGSVIAPVGEAGYVPADLFGTFRSMLDDPVVRQRLAELERFHLDHAETSWDDSHPTLAQRLEMIERLPDQGASPDPSPASELIAGQEPLVAAVQRTALARLSADADELVELSGPDWADRAATTLTRRAVEDLLEAAGEPAEPVTSLGAVLALLEAGGAERLARNLAQARTPSAAADEVDALGDLGAALFALAGCSLVAAGQAAWQLSWTGLGVLVGPGLDSAELLDLAECAVAAPVAATCFRERLDKLGLNLDASPVRPSPTVALVTADVRPSRDRVPSAETSAPTPGHWADDHPVLGAHITDLRAAPGIRNVLIASFFTMAFVPIGLLSLVVDVEAGVNWHDPLVAFGPLFAALAPMALRDSLRQRRESIRLYQGGFVHVRHARDIRVYPWDRIADISVFMRPHGGGSSVEYRSYRIRRKDGKAVTFSSAVYPQIQRLATEFSRAGSS